MRTSTHEMYEDLEATFRVRRELYTEQVAFYLQDLIVPETRERTLLEIKEVLDAPNLAVTASLIGKRIGFLGAIFTYAYLKYGIAYTIDNNKIACMKSDNYENWLPTYYLGNALVMKEEVGQNAEWIATNVYRKLLSPVIDSLSTVKGLSKKVLLENCYIYMAWIFEKKQLDMAIFYELLDLPAENFGTGVSHPIRLFHEPQTTRATCCLYYQLHTKDKCCKKCPLANKACN